MSIAKQSKEYVKDYFEKLHQRGKKMSTAKQAEEYVKDYFKEKRHIKLVKRSNRERGFDFRDESSNLFVEVKGSEKAFNDLQGWYFTNLEFEKARSCRREKKKYEIHFVVGIGSESPEHHMEFGKVFLDYAEMGVSWWLPRSHCN